jgi:RNA polymerase sigma-54 factor
MKASLQLKLSQHLTLTPQLQQSIRLLQLSTLELDQEIERFLSENPLLEREESDYAVSPLLAQINSPAPLPTNEEPRTENGGTQEEAGGTSEESTQFEEGDWGNMGTASRTRDSDEDNDFQDIQAAQVSLRSHLEEQVALTPLSDRDRALVRFIIEALDEDGYLDQELEELLPLLPEEAEVDLDELRIALRHVQSFDPSGIGARNARECLALQIRAQSPADTPTLRIHGLALNLVENHLELLAQRDFARLKRVLDCDDEILKAVQALICSLNPRPGAPYAPSDTRYIVPDVVVKKEKGQWVASLNRQVMPRLRVNQLYASILQQNRGQAGALGNQLQEARWLIKNVQQRFDTILRVSQAIVDQQRQFFDYGEVAMRPLTLREIADKLELHESTVSRVTTQKYMATPRGVLELKYFFGSHVATDTGGAASSTAIRALIRQLVEAEDGKKPLSDAKIAELLGQQGIVVARRTVAKYRESLNIPPVSLRKTL